MNKCGRGKLAGLFLITWTNYKKKRKEKLGKPKRDEAFAFVIHTIKRQGFHKQKDLFC